MLSNVKISKNDFYKMGVVNAVWEFGEFLPDEILNLLKKDKKTETQRYVHHEEPNFDNK